MQVEGEIEQEHSEFSDSVMIEHASVMTLVGQVEMTDKKNLNRHERRRQQTRELLKQTAVELILERGYESVTIQDITDTADLGRGTFYIHFKDKDDIIWAILKDKIDELQAHFFSGLGEAPLEGEFFRVMWTNLFTYVRDNRSILQLTLGEQGYAPLSRHLHKHIAEMLEQQIIAGRARLPFDVPHDFLARYMSGAMLNLMMWWLEDTDKYTPEEMATMFYHVTFGPAS